MVIMMVHGENALLSDAPSLLTVCVYVRMAFSPLFRCDLGLLFLCPFFPSFSCRN